MDAAKKLEGQLCTDTRIMDMPARDQPQMPCPPGNRAVDAVGPGLAPRMSAGRPLVVLATVAADLAVLRLVGQLLAVTGKMPGLLLDLATMFDLSSEANVPSWFQSGLLSLWARVLWTVWASTCGGRGCRTSCVEG